MTPGDGSGLGSIGAVGPVDSPASFGNGAAAVGLPLQEQLALLRESLARHGELDVRTLHYHLEQADATMREGFWHAAVNEARSFIEALIVGIAEFESARRHDQLSGLPPNGESRSGYHECRKYLVTVGFADGDEMDLFKQVYAIASRKGSHPGVTDEVWGRLVCHFCWMASYFLLSRYSAWKSHGRRRPGDPDGSGPGGQGPLGSCLQWLGGVARRVAGGHHTRTATR